jgi:hypothetical protein
MNPQQAENLRILIRHMETKVTRTLSMDAITGPCGTPACAFGEAACMPHFNALGLVALPKSTVYQCAHRLGLDEVPRVLRAPRQRAHMRAAGHRLALREGQDVHGTRGCAVRGGAGRMKATQFKPGCRQGVAVKLYKPIGTERTSKDGYLERKVNDGMPLQARWRAVHLIVWEAANGPSRKAMPSASRTATSATSRSTTWSASPRGPDARNTIHNYPKPIAELVQLRGALQRQINKGEAMANKIEDLREHLFATLARSARQGKARWTLTARRRSPRSRR